MATQMVLRIPLKSYLAVLIFTVVSVTGLQAAEPSISVEQITFGPRHHFFGYIGHVQNIPWNASGRYIVALRTGFHDHMPKPHETADVVLIDTHEKNSIIPVDLSRAEELEDTFFFVR